MAINYGGGGTPVPGSEFNLADPVNSFITTTLRVLTQPVNFFRGIMRRGDFINPTIYYFICAVIGAVLGNLLGALFTRQTFGGALLAMIFTPIFSVIFLAIVAAIIHLLVILIIGQANSGYEATYRVGAYPAALNIVNGILGWIPFVNILVSLAVGVYYIYLYIVGIREMHSTNTQKAAIVVLIPVAILVILGVCLVLTIGAALVSVSR